MDDLSSIEGVVIEEDQTRFYQDDHEVNVDQFEDDYY
jgi:hypothetical protein